MCCCKEQHLHVHQHMGAVHVEVSEEDKHLLNVCTLYFLLHELDAGACMDQIEVRHEMARL